MSNYQDMHGLVHLAAVTPHQVSTSATPEQVDFVVELDAMTRMITEHCRDVLQGKEGRWAELTEVLAEATKLCRRRIVIEVDDIGDAGGR